MGMTTLANPGPVLAEQEMLHDGEPIYDLAWGGAPVPSDPHAGHRLRSISRTTAVEHRGGDVDRCDAQPGNRRRFPEITLTVFSRAPAGASIEAPSRQASLKKVTPEGGQ